MKLPTGSTPIVPIFCAALLFSLAVLLLAAAPAQQRGPQRGPGRTVAPKIEVGEFAPDFELPFLSFAEDGEGKPIGVIHDTGTFKLSSFRGERPVCMIMSSYT